MVQMDSSYDGVQLEGLPPSYLKNGNIHYQSNIEIKTTNLVNGVSNIGQSIHNGIQSIPPQVSLLKDKIVNNSRHYFLFDEQNQRQVYNPEISEPTSISYKDSQNLFKPIGIKNNESCFEYNNNNLIDSSNSIIEKPRFRSFSSPTQFKIEFNDSVLKNNQSSTSSSPTLKPIFNNCNEESLKRIRSMSISTIEKIKQIEFEKEKKNEEFDINDVIYYVDYQERLEREELERIEKNSCILSQNSKESYSCLEIYNPISEFLNPITNLNSFTNGSCSSTLSSSTSSTTPISPRSISNSSPTNSTYSLSLPTTPSKSPSPTPTPISQSNNKFPQLKRSISATLPKLSKSSSKISISPLTIKEEPVELALPIKNQLMQLHLQKSPSTSSMTTSPRDSSRSPIPMLKSNLSSSTTSLPTLSSSGQITPTAPNNKSKGILKSHLVKCASNNNIPSLTINSSNSPKQQSPSLKSTVKIVVPGELKESFQNELKFHLKSKKDTFKDKLEKYENLKISIVEPIEPPPDNQDRIKIVFYFPTNNAKKSRYFNSNDKIQVMNEYIKYLSIMETNLFGCKFQNSEYNYQILDCDFNFTIQPTKIKIQNFNVTFKDAGFNEKSQSIININITSKNIELK